MSSHLNNEFGSPISGRARSEGLRQAFEKPLTRIDRIR